MLPAEIIERFRFSQGNGFKLADSDPDDTCGLDIDKKDAKELLETGVKRLAKLQERLYAEGRWAILAILQGIDTSGKDGVIKHVLSGVNPQGCEVHSFKQPSSLELAHDFLWRGTIALPGRGRIGIFNRSYYEETVVVRVHPELLEKQNLSPKLVTGDIWQQRYEDINNFELHLARNGTVPFKFFLNISKDEQLERLLSRADDPDKRWKFSLYDVEERKLWDKLFSRLLVAAVLVERMETLDLQFPKFDEANTEALAKAQAALRQEASKIKR
jgi:PPK2 family polyphosphate:nucleotide phosphotransferase